MNKIEQKILEFLKNNPSKNYKRKELARNLKFHRKDYPALREAIKSLTADNKIFKTHKRKYGITSVDHSSQGILAVSKNGHSFVRLDGIEESIYIHPDYVNTGMDGDKVKVEIFAQRRGRSREGRITEIVERKRLSFIGTFRKYGSFSHVVPEDPSLKRDIYISPGKDRKAKPGEKVIAKIIRWDDSSLNPEGIIEEVLGKPEQSEIAMRSVMLSYDFSEKFPKAVEEEAASISKKIPAKEYKRRLDLRKTVTVTIDPEDAKDFDDAVSLEQLSNGNQLLGVHIADVSSFVPEGKTIDKAALARATSVYLPNRCIPMLPSILSEELCSLKPKTDRLAYSVLMEVTKNGELVNYELAESVIHSHARLTYEEAQAIIDGKRRGKVPQMIRKLAELGRIIKARRLEMGSLDFDLPEITFAFDPLGVLEEIRPKLRLESHMLVEEFMLLANMTVTKLCHTWQKERAFPHYFVYRIHESPNGEKLTEYSRFLKVLKIPFKKGKRVTPRMFQKVLKRVKDTKEERLVGELTLRTMQKARYDTKNKGHFGLAFKEYTHFTSPIRRYPDLAVHRLLKLYQKSPSRDRVKREKAGLAYICSHSSEMERKALEAEREAIKIKQLEYMKSRLGDEFKGIISGVVSFGLFVELEGVLAEGMIRMKDMMDDYYEYDEEQYSLVGRNRGKKYRLGDSVRVQVINVSEQERHLDLMLVDNS